MRYEGVRRLAILAAIVVGPSWALYMMTVDAWIPRRGGDYLVGLIAAAVISGVAWALVHIIGWVVAGFTSRA